MLCLSNLILGGSNFSLNYHFRVLPASPEQSWRLNFVVFDFLSDAVDDGDAEVVVVV
jgi:hypothetical protein